MREMFPFLVGRLKTWWRKFSARLRGGFPFLVGRLKTSMCKEPLQKICAVSIPCR